MPEGEAGPEIKVRDTKFVYFSSCRPYKSSDLGTAVNEIDAPQQMDVGGNIGQAWTRVLHYRYNCNKNYENCRDEEQFYLANGYGLWQWKHYHNDHLVETALMKNIQRDRPNATLPCTESYR